ncbi:MAG: helix-turn-helix transcriptional regulator [Oscillospiraceae bacterium]|nr:helix-turn-helix transcriptional regulator [Oscillospiraceae bacterium]
MSFSENLKQIRKEHHLSQEELAELLDVSRQAVSKWEQDQGYPEVEKLLLLSKKLNISLDTLMSNEIGYDCGSNCTSVTGSITITSPHENVIANCYKVVASGKMRGGKASPQYALFGMDRGGSSFWGEPTTFLGWYASEEQISKEIAQIYNAISKGIPTYTLQFSAKTQRRWASIKMVEE